MRQFALGMLFAFSLMGCAGWKFKDHYVWYGLEAESYAGKLLGAEPKDDLDFAKCAPQDGERGKCGVFLPEELERLIHDMEKTKADLKACQEGGHPAQE